MYHFKSVDLPLAGLKLVNRKILSDDRGHLTRLFCDAEMLNFGWTNSISQINHTHTKKCGTVRGMHFQYPPHSEMKLVSCLKGQVFDVVVDVRNGSETFLQWHAEILSEKNNSSLLIPHGFAHGFQAITDDVEMIYCHSKAYAPEAESGLRATDPMLNISWPLAISVLSNRDQNFPLLESDFRGVIL